MLSRPALTRLFAGLRASNPRLLQSLTCLSAVESRGMAMAARPRPAVRENGANVSVATQAFTSSDSEASDAEPAPAARADTKPLTEFGLNKAVVAALQREGFESLFPVQWETLPTVLARGDVIVRARTGTGKTMGFVIPVLQCCVESDAASRPRRQRTPVCLVMTPTRELAVQVEGEFKRVGRHLGIRTVCVYGGASYEKQTSALEAGVDVVVGTPGRLIDMIDRGSVDLSAVQFAVLDEADDMLRVGFKEAVEQIYTHLPGGDAVKPSRSPRKLVDDAAADDDAVTSSDKPLAVQHMLWSATMPMWIRKLAAKWMNTPKFIDLVGEEESKLPSTMTHVAIPVNPKFNGDDCAGALKAVLKYFAGDATGTGRALIFTNTKAEANELAQSIHNVSGLSASALTGDLSQQMREKALDSFRRGELRCLIATDVAARGLDIPEVELVVHVEPPNEAESFVHRSGRTARAGRSGTNVVLFNPWSNTHHDALEGYEEDLGISFKLAPVPQLQMTEADINNAHKQAKGAIKGVTALKQEGLLAVVDKLATDFTPQQLAAALLSAKLPDVASLPHSIITGKQNIVTIRVPSAGRAVRAHTMKAEVVDACEGDIRAVSDVIAVQGAFLVDVSPAHVEAVLAAFPGSVELTDVADHEVKALRAHQRAANSESSRRGNSYRFGGSGSGRPRSDRDYNSSSPARRSYPAANGKSFGNGFDSRRRESPRGFDFDKEGDAFERLSTKFDRGYSRRGSERGREDGSNWRTRAPRKQYEYDEDDGDSGDKTFSKFRSGGGDDKNVWGRVATMMDKGSGSNSSSFNKKGNRFL